MSASKSLVQSSVTKVSDCCEFGRLYVLKVAGRDVDHDDDDDEKGQWNRSIASLRSELWLVYLLAPPSPRKNWRGRG